MTSRAVLAVLTLLAAPAARALKVPYLAGRVNDGAGLMSPEARERIESKLAALEGETGAQVAVLTLPSLEGEPLEDFSLRVVETWKLGRAGVDDGVLVLVARDDRQMRIEVGYGLEGALPDAAANRILANLMTPRFRAGDFDGGVEAAVDAIAGTVRGEEGLIPEDPPSSGSGGNFVVVVAFVLWLVSALFSRRFRRGRRGTMLGGWSSGRGGGFSGGGFSGGGGSFGGGGASGRW